MLTSKLKTLLDLKQKEVNAQEARATRQIAQGNEKQLKVSQSPNYLVCASQMGVSVC